MIVQKLHFIKFLFKFSLAEEGMPREKIVTFFPFRCIPYVWFESQNNKEWIANIPKMAVNSQEEV